MIPFADNFLAGSLLTILLPIGLLIVIAVWYVIAVKRIPEDTPVSSPSLPSAGMVAAADPTQPDTPEPPAAQPPNPQP
jgi:hypothetical protein